MKERDDPMAHRSHRVGASRTEIQALLYRHLPIYEHVGMTVESVENGIYRCGLPLGARNVNHLNTVHAALQWAVAEAVGGLVVVDTFGTNCFASLFVAVKSATIEFLRPARTAILAEARPDAKEIERIKALIEAGEEAQFTLRPTIQSVDGEAVARMIAEYVVRPKRAPSRPRAEREE